MKGHITTKGLNKANFDTLRFENDEENANVESGAMDSEGHPDEPRTVMEDNEVSLMSFEVAEVKLVSCY